jgi:hypothetical protein
VLGWYAEQAFERLHGVPERKTRKKIRFPIFFGIFCKIWFATGFLLATPMKHIVQVLEIITSGTT